MNAVSEHMHLRDLAFRNIKQHEANAQSCSVNFRVWNVLENHAFEKSFEVAKICDLDRKKVMLNVI